MFKRRSVKGASRSKPVRRGSESSSSDSGSDSDDGGVVRKKVRASASSKTSSTALTTALTVSTSQSNSLTQNNSITKVDTLNQEIIDSERAAKSNAAVSVLEAPSASGDGSYTGKQGYATFLKPSSNMDKIGPKKQSSNIRSTTVFDFARDICKDYKQTGFCGYGDSCKFVHARDDFKAGWKLNRDWDISNKESTIEKVVEDEIPFKCVLCKDDYKSPVKTKCGHYYCEKCFLARYKKNKTCYICGKDTNGVAMPAKSLTQLLGTT